MFGWITDFFEYIWGALGWWCCRCVSALRGEGFGDDDDEA